MKKISAKEVTSLKLLHFTKMVASGNDFVVIDRSRAQAQEKRLKQLAQFLCNRKFGIGADGLLFLEQSQKADMRMRIFNADGSEAQMCGNGARCVAYYLRLKKLRGHAGKSITIETAAGIIKSFVNGSNVKIKLTDPKGIKLDVPIIVNSRKIRVNFINTGVPHVVIFSQGLDKINVTDIAPFIRYHKRFAPKGTNVNFIEVLDDNSFKIRTYERGVEDETLACGTGSVASALIFSLKNNTRDTISVHTKSGEVLKVYFNRDAYCFSDVWLQGKAGIVFQGNIVRGDKRGGCTW